MVPFTLLISSLLCAPALATPAKTGGGESNLPRDLLLLQSFKKQITSDPHGNTSNWKGDDVCKFGGVKCEDNPNTGHKAVSGLDLNGFELEGKPLKLDGFLDKLTDLSFFHANGNGFTGSLPKDLSASKWLWEIDLSNNKLSGPFPEGVFSVNLTFLDLRFNALEGALPEQLFELDIDTLFLNDNKFSGSIPLTIGTTPARYITLARNQFKGQIPKTLGHAKHLEEILLLGNLLSGPLPTVYNNVNLTVFDVSDNKLSGPVPEALCELKKVKYLNLTNNNFDGALGPACTKLVEKEVLDISNNCINGAKGQKLAGNCKQ